MANQRILQLISTERGARVNNSGVIELPYPEYLELPRKGEHIDWETNIQGKRYLLRCNVLSLRHFPHQKRTVVEAHLWSANPL